MGKPRQFNRTKPINFKREKGRRAVLRANIFKTSSRWREVFSSEKEAFTANILKTSKPDPLHPDVVLVSSDGNEYPAHKSVLSAASSYFRAMFSGAFQEASSGRIVLHSITSTTMQLIMDYLHLDQLEQKAFKDSVQPVIVDVFHAAHMLDMTSLVKLSCTLLGEGITRANYKNTWAIYDTCPTEMLYNYLRASFRHNYRRFLNKRFLTFDLSLIKFALGQWVPFISHQLLVKLVLRWIQHSPKRREGYLHELAKIFHLERLPPGYMNYLAAEEEILQRHPDFLRQFQTSETMVAETAQFRTDAGNEVIADAISVFFFATEDDTTTVLRFSFSGCSEKKCLPFRIRVMNGKSSTYFACVQYKSKIYFVGHVDSYSEITFIEYEFDSNSFVSMDSSLVHAAEYRDAFVVGDRMYVHCLDSSSSFVQFYDFLAGCKWTRVLSSTLSKHVSLCPYGNSYLVLQADGDKNATKVTRVNESSSFTIPCKYNNDVVVHYNGRLWGFSERRGDYEKRKFVYDVDKKCFKSNSDYKAPCSHTRFMRIHSLQRHPLIVVWKILPHRKRHLMLLDTENDTVLGQIEYTFSWKKCNPMGMLTYCKDMTL